MVNLPETITKRIKNILYNAKSIEDRNTRHKNIQDSLLELFKGLKCYTVREYLIEYDRKYRSQSTFNHHEYR